MLHQKRLPTLKQLRHLSAVAEHGHFGRAATSCFITQSTLSSSIKELEALLGRILIERTRRTVIITPLGQEIVARARQILNDVGELVDLVGASGAPLSGPLRLGTIPTIGPYLLPRALPAIRAAHPDLKLFLREDQSARLVEDLNAGKLDLLLLAFPYPTEGLQSLIFASDAFVVALPHNHPLTRHDRLKPSDLETRELLLLEEGHCLRDHAMSACHLPSDTATADFQGTSLHTLVQMVDNGLGLTLLPRIAVEAGLIKGTRVQLRPLAGDPVTRHIGMAWRKSSPRAEEFALLSTFFQPGNAGQ